MRRKFHSFDALDAFTDLFILRGLPDCIRSDSGAESIADQLRACIGHQGFLYPGITIGNGSCESINARLRDELSNGEILSKLCEVQSLIDG